jgi:TrmH family RNA methyltransferase
MPREEITSLQNPRVKRAIKLRDSRQRMKQGRYLIDGARELLRAIQAGAALEEVYVCSSLCRSEECRAVIERLRDLPIEIVHVAPAVMEKLAFGERAEGVLGVAAARARRLNELTLPADPLVVVLEGVEKPGNVGAVLRSADAAGVHALIVADGGTDLYNPNAIRASLGTIFTVPVCTASSRETIDWLTERGLKVFAARVDARQLYTEADYRGPTALVLGSEAGGLSEAWSAAGISRVRLPMRGVADSLNVSAAAAVLFYEALRQRSSG